MQIICVKVNECNGPVLHEKIDSALEEIRSFLEDETIVDLVITVTREEMTQEELDATPEFMGY